MKLLLRKSLILYLLLHTTTTMLLSQDIEQWDFNRCIDQALKYGLNMQYESYQDELVDLQHVKSKAAFLPNIEGNSGFNMNLGRSIDPITNEFTQDPVYYSSAGINANLTLFDGFKNWLNLKKNELNKLNRDDARRKQVRDLHINVAMIYVDILFKNEAIEALRKALIITRVQLERMEALVKAGRQSKGNIYDLKAKILKDQVRLMSADNELNERKMSLKSMLQIEHEDFELAPIKFDEYDLSSLDLQSIMNNTKLQELPEFSVNRRKLEMRDIDLTKARRTKLPILSVVYSLRSSVSNTAAQIVRTENTNTSIVVPIGYVSTDGGVSVDNLVYQEYIPPVQPVIEKLKFDSQLEQNFNQTLGLNVSVPILNNRNVFRQSIRKAEIDQKLAQLENKRKEDELVLKLSELTNKVKVSYRSYQQHLARQEALSESFRISEESYNAGRVDYLNYVTSKNNIEQGEVELFKAKYEFILNTKILNAYSQETISFNSH